jgi:hypothetical protein
MKAVRIILSAALVTVGGIIAVTALLKIISILN